MMNDTSGNLELNERETAAVLAGLRLLQEARRVTILAKISTQGVQAVLKDPCGRVQDIATDGGRFKPLNMTELDALCERINSA